MMVHTASVLARCSTATGRASRRTFNGAVERRAKPDVLEPAQMRDGGVESDSPFRIRVTL